MYQFVEILGETETPDKYLTLLFEQRQKSRQRIHLDSGEEVGLFLPRGTVLRSGDRLRSECGLVVAVRAAPEAVSDVATADTRLLSRACYHLGNRHVPIQIGKGWLRYLRDHVLDEMLAGFGLQPQHQVLPFEPEAGAYHRHSNHE